MEQEISKNLKRMKALALIALVVAVVSLVFAYVLYRNVSSPLEKIQKEQLANLESKVNFLVSSRLDGRMDVELQLAILNIQELVDSSSGEVNIQAQKALIETQALLDTLRKTRTPVPEKAEAQ